LRAGARLSAGKFATHMNRVVAIFDVDQTLLLGYSERLFFRYLVRRGLIPLPRALGYLLRLARCPEKRFRDKTYLEGLAVEDILHLARQFYEEELFPRLSAVGRACVREHQSQGHGIILLTGSLSFLMLPLKEDLGADWLIATEVARNGRFFTGQISGLHPRGENKLRLLLELSQTQGLDLSHSYAYADHFQDCHLFHRIGNPVAVNPSWRLRRLARRHRWAIRSF
jgi:putative phosphoserine phosphatase/1-acylglycerol-3-phosphate O-acyltransferase